MQIHNAVITGSFSYNGADLSNVTSSNAYSASLSTRVTQIERVYATTGSNSFRADQSVTGSLTVTGQIVAQSLNVQQVTSSIVFSSGSNTFGCDLNSRQTFTGSVIMTGSLIVNTTGVEFQVNNNGVILGNLLTDNHSITGSLRITGSIAYFAGCLGAGTVTGNGYRLEAVNPSSPSSATNLFYGLHSGNNTLTIKQFGASHPTSPYVNQIGVLNAEQHLHFVTDTQACIDAGTSTKGIFLKCGGNVGIGTQTPGYKLDVQGGWINVCGAQNASGYQYQNSGAGHTLVMNANDSYAQLYTTTNTSIFFGTSNDIRLKLFNTGETCFKCNAYFCSSTYGIMGLGEKVFDKKCFVMTSSGTVCLSLDGLIYGSGPTRAIYIYGTLLGNDALHYAHLVYFYRNDYGGLMQANIAQASCVHPSTAGQPYTFSVNDPVGLGKSACPLLLRLTSAGAGVAPGSYCSEMRIVVYNIPG